MNDVLNGTEIRRAELESHLLKCADCRTHWRAISRAQELVAGLVSPSPSPEQLDALTVRVTAAAARQSAPTPARWVAPTRLGIVSASILLVFALGIAVGRQAWPREVTVPQVVTRREVVERPIEVRVPVVTERVVVREVPVVRTRVVYRPAPTPPAAPEPQATDTTGPGPMPMLIALEPVVSQELQEATDVARPTEAEQVTPPPGSDAAADQDVRPKMVAHARTHGAPRERSI